MFFRKFALVLTLFCLPLSGMAEAADLTATPAMEFLSPAPVTTPDPLSLELITPSPAPLATEILESEMEDDGIIRVDLRSLGTPQALHLTLAGVYTVEHDAGFRFARGTEIALASVDGRIVMQVGGLTIDMGSSMTLTRHADPDGDENGIYISESEKNSLYCGDLTVSAEEDEGLRAVLAIGIEDYLYGVVAYEMSDSFPIEALKSQAIAARTYALQRKYSAGGRDYDVVDTTADQVFKGYDSQYANVIAAVDATRGIVGTYNGYLAQCYYTASNGGQTALATDIWGGDGDYGYLEMRDDPYDLENPRSLVNAVTFSDSCEDNALLRTMLQQALDVEMKDSNALEYSMESIRSIEPVSPKFEGSRMYTFLRFTLNVRALTPVENPLPTATAAPSEGLSATPDTSAAATLPPAEAFSNTPAPTDGSLMNLFYALSDPQATLAPKWETLEVAVELSVYDQIKDILSLGLNGNDYELVSVVDGDGTFTIEMRRFGHGVGMSQRGAQWMAGEYGMKFAEILNFYYPGMALERIEWDSPALTELSPLPVGLGAARPEPSPTPTPAPLPALADGEQYARVVLESSASMLNVREESSTSARILDRFADGRRVIVCGEADAEGWVRIRTAELEGYVKLEYLEME